jgi:MFS family permease
MAGFATGLFAVQTFWGFTWATLPLFLRGFAGSNTVTGILLSTTGITGIILPVLSGMLSDRISTRWGRRRPVIAAGWGLACAALLAMPWVPALPAVLALLVLAYAGFFTAMGPYFALLADTFRPEERSTATGIMFLVGGTGILSYLLVPPGCMKSGACGRSSGPSAASSSRTRCSLR